MIITAAEEVVVTQSNSRMGGAQYYASSYSYVGFWTPNYLSFKKPADSSLSMRQSTVRAHLDLFTFRAIACLIVAQPSPDQLEEVMSHASSPSNLRKLSRTPVAEQFDKIKSHALLPHNTISRYNTTSPDLNWDLLTALIGYAVPCYIASCTLVAAGETVTFPLSGKWDPSGLLQDRVSLHPEARFPTQK